jgi:magnesium-transporting ATPase (P-type)
MTQRSPLVVISSTRCATPSLARTAPKVLRNSSFWKEPVDRLLSRLGTITAAGLDAAEVQSRLKTFGPNDAAVVKRSPLWLQFVSRFRNPLVIILLVASGLSAATGAK